MSTICSAGHRRRVEEVNEAVLPPRVQPLPHTSLDVLFNTGRQLYGRCPDCGGACPAVGAHITFRAPAVCRAAGERMTGACEEDRF